MKNPVIARVSECGSDIVYKTGLLSHKVSECSIFNGFGGSKVS